MLSRLASRHSSQGLLAELVDAIDASENLTQDDEPRSRATSRALENIRASGRQYSEVLNSSGCS